MFLNHEIMSILKGMPLVEDGILVVALLCNLAIYPSKSSTNRIYLQVCCVVALLMPIYIVLRSSIGAISSGMFVSPWMYIFGVIWVSLQLAVFAPTNIVIIGILANATSIHRIKVWGIVAFVSIILSWLGIAFLLYGLS